MVRITALEDQHQTFSINSSFITCKIWGSHDGAY